MGKAGRPPFVPSEEQIQKVKALTEVRAPHEDIAKAIEVSVPTLRKYFSEHLFFPKKNRATPQNTDREFSQADREKVIRYIGCKMSTRDIGRVFGLTVGEVEEIFAEEIETGRAKYRAKVLDKLDHQMEAGTIGATNRLEALSAIPDPSENRPEVQRAGIVGKKAAAAAAAGQAATGGGAFAPPAGPRLAINNDKPT